LRRHIWRPRRFRALLDRFGGRLPVPEGRRALARAVADRGVAEVLAAHGPDMGLRSPAEVLARVETLQADLAAPPIPAAEVAV
ncbi:hypothetical protein, partial [Halomonas marinisediminis]